MLFSVTLKNNYEFRRLYAKGKSAGTSRIVLYCRRNNSSGNRFGITVSTKVGKAVHRNRIRRRFREIYRLNEPKIREGFDLVVVARTRSRYSQYRELEEDFLGLAGKLGLLKGI